jgi:murein DD-endopeptidase MepM/ murein hydrolase activator NlpD
VSALFGPTLVVGLLALCGAVSSPTLAAQTPPAPKPAASKSKSKAKKRVKKPAARAVRKPAVRVARKPAGKPLPPPAEIPTVVESASVWRGCLGSRDLPKLALSLGMEQPRLASLLEEKGLLEGPGGGCVAYVAATGGEAGVASAIFQHTEPGGGSSTLAFHKTGDTTIVTPGVCNCQESTRREMSLPAREFMASLNADSESIPPNMRWQLNILVPRMISGLSANGGLNAKRTTESVEPAWEGDSEAGGVSRDSQFRESQPRSDSEQAGPQQYETPLEGYTVRVVVGRHSDEAERLESVEIVDPASGKRVNGAWWLDRPDGPGVMIGMDGVAYERLLWESPVKYTRSSRGVGVSVNTLRRRVPAKKGSPKSTVVRTIKVPGYHLGVDMTAAKGTDVHAVGDAKVSFAGRRGAFGNLIILDHGHGYQTYYAHLSKILKGVKAGTPIARGDVIGLVGSTGRSTAPHLHFETRKDGVYLDPFDESRQLGFWLLTADEQERLAMELLSEAPVAAEKESALR